jgi:hypothetical protein
VAPGTSGPCSTHGKSLMFVHLLPFFARPKKVTKVPLYGMPPYLYLLLWRQKNAELKRTENRASVRMPEACESPAIAVAHGSSDCIHIDRPKLKVSSVIHLRVNGSYSFTPRRCCT